LRIILDDGFWLSASGIWPLWPKAKSQKPIAEFTI